MAKYVWVNPDRLQNARTTRHVGGIELIVELSPYDAPKAIVGQYDAKKGTFAISFEYIDEEDALARPCRGVTISTGKYSGKLLAISIPIDAPPLDQAAVIQLQTKVFGALDDMGEGRRKARLNHSVARELVHESFDELAGDLVAAN